MKVISLLNQKGGCGKTTCAVNISHALAQKGYRTLLIDMDSQAHATFSLAISSNLTACDMFERYAESGSCDIEDIIVKRYDTFSVIPGSLGMTALEYKLSTRPDKLMMLHNILLANERKYDFCIIDCPPNLGMLSLNALFSSVMVITPIMTCELSLHGVKVIDQVLEMTEKMRPNKDVEHYFLVNQYDKRFRHSTDMFESIQERLSGRLLDTVIRTNITLRSAMGEGMTIFEYNPKARGAADFHDLAEELLFSGKASGWVNFSLNDRAADDVYVVGDFNDWQKTEEYRLKKVNDTTWALNLALKKGKYQYKFISSGQWINDPGNEMTEDDSYGGKNSVIYIK